MEWNEKREREQKRKIGSAKEEEKIVDLMNENTHTNNHTNREREREADTEECVAESDQVREFHRTQEWKQATAVSAASK